MIKINTPRKSADRMSLALDLLIEYLLETYQEDVNVDEAKTLQGLRNRSMSIDERYKNSPIS